MKRSWENWIHIAAAIQANTCFEVWPQFFATVHWTHHKIMSFVILNMIISINVTNSEFKVKFYSSVFLSCLDMCYADMWIVKV